MKNSENKLKIWETAALVALCIALCVGTWAQARQNAISSDLVRLHVIAVSDDEHEQDIKLKVRDAVLNYLKPVLKDAENSKEAKKIISDHLNGIAGAAAKASDGRGVKVSLDWEHYPTKSYEGFTLPAGNYESLKIVLGEGQGHNWWCIVFPPLCLEAAQAQQVESVMAKEDYAIVSDSEGYELRFKLVELWGELVDKLSA